MADLLSVDDAIARIVAGAVPIDAETVPLDAADGRTLAAPLAALRTQPPFPASAMDGYAVRVADIAAPPVRLRLLGMSAAGAGFAGKVGPGDAVRIFTGAPVPEGADAILIQEDAEALETSAVVARAGVAAGRYVRPAGLDFKTGAVLLYAGRDLASRELALAAAMGHATLPVRRRPKIAIVSTGDELVPPGTMPTGDQIIAASAPGLAAYIRSIGGEPYDLGIVGDNLADTERAIDQAVSLPADILMTLGGASVGDHDLVGKALAARGMALDFWKIAMRPGKPLMFGRIGAMRVLGLPGNPVSSLVCALLFLAPLVDTLLGRPLRDRSEPAVLAVNIAANDHRQDYVRATLTQADDLPLVTPLPRQDSSQLSVLAAADCLLVRAVNAPAAKAGDACRIIRLR
ncbi:MAG: gephyrin-like molybdotransferase Glp [Bauldia sp.]